MRTCVWCVCVFLGGGRGRVRGVIYYLESKSPLERMPAEAVSVRGASGWWLPRQPGVSSRVAAVLEWRASACELYAGALPWKPDRLQEGWTIVRSSCRAARLLRRRARGVCDTKACDTKLPARVSVLFMDVLWPSVRALGLPCVFRRWGLCAFFVVLCDRRREDGAHRGTRPHGS